MSLDKILILFILSTLASSVDGADDTFYIRHHKGKCLAFDPAKGLVFHKVCTQKFRWRSGARLFHVQTNKCVSPVSASAGSVISLSDECSGTSSLFQYSRLSHYLHHIPTSFCLLPKSGVTDAAENETLSFSHTCSTYGSKFYFVPVANYVIRHFTSGFCWIHNKDNNLFELKNTYVCDRFWYSSSNNLRHLKTDKCVMANADRKLSLTTDCSSTKSEFKLLPNELLYVPGENKCVHPTGGSSQPTEGTSLSLAICPNENRCKWKLYDDRDILDITVLSESLDDSAAPNGHITVNGYQYSFNTRGINIAVFDFRSSMLETRIGYDIYGDPSTRSKMATFLNSLPPAKLLLMAARDSVTMSTDLTLALQKVGVSATFATTSPPKDRLSMAAIFYTGDTRHFWEKTVNKVGGSGSSKIHKVLYLYRDRKSTDDCSEEMGMRTGKIPDNKITSNYVFEGNAGAFGPQNARLHNSQSWCGGSAMSSDYIQVDLGSIKTISGIVTQTYSHSRTYLHPIQRFYITYSEDGATWKEYQGHGSTRKELVGNINVYESLVVNWLARIQLRFLRIITLARYTDLNTHCLRMELLGCDLRQTTVNDDLFTMKSLQITDQAAGQFSFHGAAINKQNVTIQVSTAESNSSLADYVDQFHFYSANETSISSTGQKRRDQARITKFAENKLSMNSRLKLEYFSLQSSHYQFIVQLGFWVIDSQVQSGHIWYTYTYESPNGIIVLSSPITLQRRSPDEAIMIFDVSKGNTQVLRNGDQLLLNVSLTPWIGDKDRSSTNAFQLGTYIYYDAQFFSLLSMHAVNLANGSLPPSQNTSKTGFIHLENEEFGPLNKQLVTVNFQFIIPQHFLKADKCAGQILIEFKYRTNSPKFNGKWNTTLEKSIDYKCKINRKDTDLTSGPLQLPAYSVAYDEINNDLVVCKSRQTSESAHLPSCYMQKNSNSVWVSLPKIAALVGIDTTKRHLYGIDIMGKGYWRSTQPFTEFNQVDDNEWLNIRDQSHVRRAKETSSINNLPSQPTTSWNLPSSGDASIALTKRGVHRMMDGNWKRVFQF